MKDPRRLLDGDGSDEQRALLRAGTLEEPAPEGRARLLAALGVTAPTPSEAPIAGDAGAASSTLAAGGSAISASKLVVLALGSVALVGAGALLWARGETPAGRDARTSPSASSTSASPSTLARGEETARSAEPAGSVALEIEALERVRSQLGHKDGQAALGALSRYASAHPRGVLAHEAEVLRVEALWLEGDAAAALELAERLLQRHADSPHRDRLQALARQARAASAP